MVNILTNDFTPYQNRFNEICKEIDRYTFSAYGDSLYFVIEGFEDDYHNNLAAYHIMKRVNEFYNKNSIEAKIASSKNIVSVYKTRVSFIDKVTSYINSISNGRFRKNKAA